MLKHHNFQKIEFDNSELGHDDVHIWSLSMDNSDIQLDNLFCLLSQDEVERVERFHFQKDKRQYIIARAVLRNILSLYVDREPDQHIFVYSRYGKPFLKNNGNLYFNLSHSNQRVLYALTYKKKIGVDIEFLKPCYDAEQISKQFFSDYEKKQILKASSSSKSKIFFDIWTRKEAYVKAIGKGLSMPLDAFSVTINDNEPKVFFDSNYPAQENKNWALNSIEIDDMYVAAYAVEGKNITIKQRKWSWEKNTNYLLEAV